MAFDLGAIAARLTVSGQQQFSQTMTGAEGDLKKVATAGKTVDDALGKAGVTTDRFRDQVKAIRSELGGMSSETQAAFTTVGTGMLAAGAAVAAGVGLAISKNQEYEREVSKIIAVTGVQGDALRSVRKETQELGASTVYTATEAGQGLENLAKAGVSVKDALGGGLAGTLSLASAGELDVADAAEIAATALTTFNLKGAEVPHVADLLAAGAGKAQGSVQDMSYAMKQGSLVASQMGISVDDTVGTLSAFASAGLIGSDAGTSFRTMLLSLANPSTAAANTLKQYNINAYDAQGNFVGMANLAEQLKTKLAGATQEQRNQALATIFGSDAIRAASVLYANGAKGIQDWTDKVNDSGYAARFAAQMQDNLSGDVEKLGGAFDTALIQSGSAGNDELRQMVQTLTSLVDLYNDLPAPVQQSAVVIAAVTAAALLAGGAFLIGVPKVIAFREAVQTINTEMPRTSSALRSMGSVLAGPWGIALTAAIALIGIWVQSQAEAKQRINELSDTLDEQTGAFTENTRAAAIKRLQDEGIYDAAKKAGIGIHEVNDAVFRGGDALESYNKKTAEYYGSVGVGGNVIRAFNGDADRLAHGVDNLRSDLDSAKEAHKQLADAQKDGAVASDANADSTTTAAKAYVDAAQDAEHLTDQINELIDSINKANGVGQDAVSANAAYQKSLDDVRKKVDDLKNSHDAGARSIDETTVAGSANADMFADLAKASQDAAERQFALTGNTDEYRAALGAGRQALYDQIVGLTGNADAAQRLTDKIYAMPSQKEIDFIADTSQAARTIDDYMRQYGTRVGSIIYRSTIADTPGVQRFGIANGAIMRYADGGLNTFAQGSSIEQHVAQIAPAGAYRVWAERETGGEAYIPLAPAKRSRSTAILAQVADEFGLALVPAGAARMADGSSGSVMGGGRPQTIIVKIGETELRQIAREEIDDNAVALYVAVSGGVNP